LSNQEPFSPSVFVDVNNDNFVSPIDALMVINFLNKNGNGEGEAQFVEPLESYPLAWPIDDLLELLAKDQSRSRVA